VRPPAVELGGGVVETRDGQLVALEPGDCMVPRDRCVEYVSQAEGCFAEREVLRKAPPPALPWWAVLVVGLAAFGAGVAFAGAVSP
jgi:hypothetical protein